MILTEVWLDEDELLDNAICLRLSDDETECPLAVYIESEPLIHDVVVAGISLVIRCILKSGEIVSAFCTTSYVAQSVVAPLVASTQGLPLDCTVSSTLVTRQASHRCPTPAVATFVSNVAVLAEVSEEVHVVPTVSVPGIGALNCVAGESQIKSGGLVDAFMGIMGAGNANKRCRGVLALHTLGKHHVCSVDSGGMFRVWDISNESSAGQLNLLANISPRAHEAGGTALIEEVLFTAMPLDQGEAMTRLAACAVWGPAGWHVFLLNWTSDKAYCTPSVSVVDIDPATLGPDFEQASLVALHLTWSYAGADDRTGQAIDSCPQLTSLWVSSGGSSGQLQSSIRSYGLDDPTSVEAPNEDFRRNLQSQQEQLVHSVQTVLSTSSASLDNLINSRDKAHVRVPTRDALVWAALWPLVFAPGRYSSRVLWASILDAGDRAQSSTIQPSNGSVAAIASTVVSHCGNLDSAEEYLKSCEFRTYREQRRARGTGYLQPDWGSESAAIGMPVAARTDSLTLLLPFRKKVEKYGFTTEVLRLRHDALTAVNESLSADIRSQFLLQLQTKFILPVDARSKGVTAELIAWTEARLDVLAGNIPPLHNHLLSRLATAIHDRNFMEGLLPIWGTPGSTATGISDAPSTPVSMIAALAGAAICDITEQLLSVCVLIAKVRRGVGLSKSIQWASHFSLATTELLYASLLNWMHISYPQDSTALKRRVDRPIRCPNSHHNESSRANQGNRSNRVPPGNLSALDCFWYSAYSSISTEIANKGTTSGNGLRTDAVITVPTSVMTACLRVLRPSGATQLPLYLAEESQSISLRLLAGLLEVHYELTEVVLSLNSSRNSREAFTENRENLAASLLQSRLRSLSACGSLCSSLWAITKLEPGSANNLDRRPPKAFLDDVELHAADLLASAPRPLVVPGSAEGDVLSEVAGPCIDGHPASMNEISATKSAFQEAVSMWEKASLSRNITNGHFGEGNNILRENALADQIKCTANTLSHLVDDNECILALAALHRENNDPASVIDVILDKYAGFISHVATISHVKDCLDILRGARAVSGGKVGPKVCLQASYVLMEAVTTCIEEYQDFLDQYTWIKDYVYADVRTAWTRIFNFSLESNRFEDALSAVGQMLDLDNEDTDAATESDDCGIKLWEASLRSLVGAACEHGQLEWLCQLPDIVVRGVTLTTHIAASLRRLSESRSVSTTGVNYYESLGAFYCSRRSYRQAALVWHAYAARIASSLPCQGSVSNMRSGHADSQGASVTAAAKLRSTALTASLICLSLVPPEQQFLLVVPSAGSSATEHQTNTLISESALRVSFLSACAAARLGKPYFNPQSALEGLCNDIFSSTESTKISNAILAVSLAATGIQAAKAATHASLSPPQGRFSPHWSLSNAKHGLLSAIAALTRASAILASGGEANDTGPNVWQPQRTDEFAADFDSDHECHPSCRYSILLYLLKFLDGAHNGYALRTEAVRALLAARPAEKLPPELIHSHDGNAHHSGHGGASFAAGHDFAAIVSEMFEAGRLSDACQLATAALKGSEYRRNLGGKNSTSIVVYMLLDRLLLGCRAVLNDFVPRSEDDKVEVRELSASTQALEAQLRVHFSHLAVQ